MFVRYRPLCGRSSRVHTRGRRGAYQVVLCAIPSGRAVIERRNRISAQGHLSTSPTCRLFVPHPTLCFSTCSSQLKPWALIRFYFRGWRHRHAYPGDLLNFRHTLPHSRGDPRMCGLLFGCLPGQKFGGNRGKREAQYVVEVIVNSCIYSVRNKARSVNRGHGTILSGGSPGRYSVSPFTPIPSE
jgi:hypothetical protein